MFGVLVALLPLLFNLVDLRLHKHETGVHEILSRGELLLVMSVMCAGAVGELFGSEKTFGVMKIFAGGSAVILLLCSSLYYADIWTSYSAKVEIDTGLVASMSIYLYLASLVTCAACIALSEL